MGQFGVLFSQPSTPDIQKQITTISGEDPFKRVFQSHNCKGTALFLDLTYYRNSLFWDPNYYDRQRHSLKKDIMSIVMQLEPGVLLCGNMRQDDYVKEVLSQLSQEHGLSIQT